VELTVWVDDWQMQCCGEPFAVGSKVSWTLRDTDAEWLATVLGPDATMKVDAAEEHHGGAPDDAPVVEGLVRSIAAVHCRYAPRPGENPRMFHPVPGSGLVTEVSSADGWTRGQNGLEFAGYIVRLAASSP
jgi:hypothetical protein